MSTKLRLPGVCDQTIERQRSAVRGIHHRWLPAACAVLLLEAVSSPPAYAQLCAGRSSFNLSPTHFELDAGLNPRGRSIGASVGHGTDALFGVASAAAHTLKGGDRAYVVAATIGTDQILTPDNRLHICPMIIAGYESGADAAGDGGRAGISMAADAAMMIVNTPAMRMMHTIGLDLRYRGMSRTTALFAQEQDRHHMTLSAGIGFVIRNRLSIVSKAIVPFGPVDRTGVQMTVGYNVLRR
jgi:hypothetical protein